MKKRKKLFPFLAVLLVICAAFGILTLSATATELPEPPEIERVKAVYFYDITHEELLVSENADKLLNTSTTAKIMMGLVACEELSDKLDETVTVTSEMLDGVIGNSMKLTAGDKLTVKDLLYAAICGSYNDAAYCLAHIVSGDRESFVGLMNDRAASLSAKNTYYTNPIGYPDNDAMLTTAEDTAKIALAAYENELYMEICSAVKFETSYKVDGEAKIIYNRNYLVASNVTTAYFNSKCSGMNAGYTGEAGGWSVVTVARDNDEADHLCIILGGEENEDGSVIYAYRVANKLVDWAVETYGTVNVVKEGVEWGMTSINYTGLTTNDAPYLTASAIDAYLPVDVDIENDLKYEVIFDSESIDAPIEAGTRIGVLRVSYNGRNVGECELVLENSYERNAIVSGIQVLSDYTHSRAFIATLVCFAVLLVVTLIVMRQRYYKYNGRLRR